MSTYHSGVNLWPAAGIILARTIQIWWDRFTHTDHPSSIARMDIVVKWGHERFHFLTARDDTTLGDLREFVVGQTHLKVGSFKLIFSGGIMKDDNALLAAYGIKRGSAVTVIGSHDKGAKPTSSINMAAAIAKTEQNCILSIQNEVDAVNRNLRPSLEGFLQNTPETGAEFDFEHRRIGELLLQSLLRLDALSPESHWSEARSRRKEAVKEIQAMLSGLDKVDQRETEPH